MKGIKLRYDFLVFLCAYLTQIDLSLDRSLWSSWKELQNYYKTVIPPGRVANYLLSYSKPENVSVKPFFVKTIGSLGNLKFALLRLFSMNAYLKPTEILYCIELNHTFQKYLDASSEINKLEVEKLRVDVSEFAHNVIRHRIDMKDQAKCHRIERFLQNENLKAIKMEEFTKGLEL